MTVSREEVLEKVKEIMAELFELQPENIQMESRLNEDLGLDSIDAIDLITYLQSYVGQRLQPEEFRTVRTISDVVTTAQATLNQAEQKSQASEKK